MTFCWREFWIHASFYKKFVYKKHDAEIRQKLRNIQEA